MATCEICSDADLLLGDLCRCMIEELERYIPIATATYREIIKKNTEVE